MPLKAIVTTLDGLSEELKKEYKSKDGKFYLDVSEVDGYALEDARNLKSALARERESAREANDKLKSLADFDIDAAKEALRKVKEWQDSPPEKKFEEQFKAREEQLLKKHKTEIDTKDGSIKDLTSQLEEQLITASATQAIAAKKGSIDLLLPIVARQTRIRRVSDGRFIVEVLDDKKQPRISSKQGSQDAMSIGELVDEMSKTEVYGRAFDGTGNSGTGAVSGVTKGANGAHVISAADARDIRKYRAAKEAATKANVALEIGS